MKSNNHFFHEIHNAHQEYWKQAKVDLVENHAIHHERTKEFASYIMDSLVTGTPYRIHANVPVLYPEHTDICF